MFVNDCSTGFSYRVANKKYFHGKPGAMEISGVPGGRNPRKPDRAQPLYKWTGWTPTKDGEARSSWLQLGPARGVWADLFEPVLTGGHPIHALGDLGTLEG